MRTDVSGGGGGEERRRSVEMGAGRMEGGGVRVHIKPRSIHPSGEEPVMVLTWLAERERGSF